MPQPFRLTLLALGAVLAQWLFFGRLQIGGAFPDIVLLFVAWVGIHKGRKAGALAGFSCGVLMDLLADTWGLQMLIKTIVGFLVGAFPASERESLLILPRQAFLGGMVIALVQNGMLVTFLALQTGSRDPFLVTALWIGSSIYTAAVGTIGAVTFGR